jgi:hypothetical protein
MCAALLLAADFSLNPVYRLSGKLSGDCTFTLKR